MSCIDRWILSSLSGSACVLLLACANGRDLDALDVPGHDGGVWYLQTHDDEAGSGGSAGAQGSAGVGVGSGTTSEGGSGAGTTGGGSGTGGRSGSGGNTAPPLGNGGSGGSGFPGFPGGGQNQGGNSGFPGFPGGGGQNMGGGGNLPVHDVTACAPCDTFAGSRGDVAGCCTADNQCGSDLSSVGGSDECIAHDQPGTMTSACPEISIMQGGYMIPGCCRATGQCGIMITMTAPLGCIDPSIVESFLQFDAPVGPARPCRP